MRKPWVVDTNVGIVANDRSADGSHLPGSVVACAEFLKSITRSGSVAVDMGWQVITDRLRPLTPLGFIRLAVASTVRPLPGGATHLARSDAQNAGGTV